MAVLTVTATQERGYLARRHGLHPAAPARSIGQVAAGHAGLHAARLPTPYVTLRARLTEFTAPQLRAALAPRGELIKLRTCRRTLHIYPVAEAPAAHVATRGLRLGACAASARRLGYEPTALRRFTTAVRAALAGGPLPHRELEQQAHATTRRVRTGQEIRTPLIRLAIKWLWEQGDLTYRNTADSMHREVREFQLTTQAHPDLHLNALEQDSAVSLLLRRYLAAFGPASVSDFAWWSGLNQRDIAPALATLYPDVITVRIEDQPTDLLLLAEHEHDLRAAEPLPRQHIQLLAYEDPALKGYFTTRYRYIEDTHHQILFNTIGEARASIAVAGRCVGTWRFHRATRTIDQDIYGRVTGSVRRAIHTRLDEMTDFLRAEPC